MKAQDKEEKDRIKFKFATGLHLALQDSKLNSFRKVAKEAGMEPAHIQKISVGKLDISLTKSIAIAAALGISYTELASYYDKVTDSDIQDYIVHLERQRKSRGKKSKK